MARRRKQTHDPRQLSLFDVMANQIEEIREENIQDDMREESIQKLHLVATSDADPDRQLEFTLDAGLAVSSLKLPKAEKGAEEDATLLINADADICSRVADMVEGMATA